MHTFSARCNRTGLASRRGCNTSNPAHEHCNVSPVLVQRNGIRSLPWQPRIRGAPHSCFGTSSCSGFALRGVLQRLRSVGIIGEGTGLQCCHLRQEGRRHPPGPQHHRRHGVTALLCKMYTRARGGAIKGLAFLQNVSSLLASQLGCPRSQDSVSEMAGSSKDNQNQSKFDAMTRA